VDGALCASASRGACARPRDQARIRGRRGYPRQTRDSVLTALDGAERAATAQRITPAPGPSLPAVLPPELRSSGGPSASTARKPTRRARRTQP
jgi:hypothetical protein